MCQGWRDEGEKDFRNSESLFNMVIEPTFTDVLLVATCICFIVFF